MKGYVMRASLSPSYAYNSSRDPDALSRQAPQPLAAAPSPASVAPQEWTIREMAGEFGVSLRALRFYEDRGLIQPRREGNARYYGASDRRRLQMILSGKQLGFTLSEIGDLIGAQGAGSESEFEEKLGAAQIVTQIDHLERQRSDINEAIEKLRATRDRMAHSLGGA
jgi:DNA-binding transcriptional MerR regulator